MGCQSRQENAVEILIRHQAPLETPNAYGGTVLGCTVWSAIHEPKQGHLRIIEALLQAGAQVGAAGYRSGDERVDAVLKRHCGQDPLKGWSQPVIPLQIFVKQSIPLGCVLYDNSCGFCNRWIPFWASTLQRRGLETSPLQAEWVRSRLALSEAELLQDLLLLLADGRLVRGADVYRFVMRRVWWAYPFYLLSIAPVGRSAFDWSYRTFARHRFRVSRACVRFKRSGRGIAS